MIRNLFRIKPGRLTQSPAPRHLAETPTERTRRLEIVAKIYGSVGHGRHRTLAGMPSIDASDAEWMQAIR